MKKLHLLLIAQFVIYLYGLNISCNAQIVKITPGNASADEPVTITYDASKGTGGLIGANSVYMHSGAILEDDGEDWTNVVGNWGEDDGLGRMTKVEGEENLWSISIPESLRSYYNVKNGIDIFRLGIVFRNADGTKEGKGTFGKFEGGETIANGNIFLNLNVAQFIKVEDPSGDVAFLNSKNKLAIKVKASAVASEIKVNASNTSTYTEELTANDVQEFIFELTPPVPNGTINISLNATINGNPTTPIITTINYVELKPLVEKPLPENIKQGINIIDNQTVIFALAAPNKNTVHVLGDFNNWTINSNSQLVNFDKTKNIFWSSINGLDPTIEYAYEYLIDGKISVADPFSTKVLDKFNDSFIPVTTYPSLKNFPEKAKSNIVSSFQTETNKYTWSLDESTWSRPQKDELIIYELLVRDFTENRNYKTLIDSIGYFKKLGINAIELMPVAEFEGNLSWGYNTSYAMALDKFYGTENDFKSFVDACHQNGIAIIMDVVFNHVFSQSPFFQMWREGDQPTIENPYLNVEATHPFNVGYDLNHESELTRSYIKQVVEYWVQEFHIDGYRFDLSKGFTQKKTLNDAAFRVKDQSRIDNILNITDNLQAIDKDLYLILEHFAASDEEKNYTDKGLLPWRNRHFDYKDAINGTNKSFSFDNTSDFITYFSSHDEERLLVEADNNGQINGAYDIKKESIALNRMMTAYSFFFLSEGPKMFWMFDEYGYPISINKNGRTGEKPYPNNINGIDWTNKRNVKQLLNTTSSVIKLRQENLTSFKNGEIFSVLDKEVKSFILKHSDLNLVLVGNLSLSEKSQTVDFPVEGEWINLVTGSKEMIAKNKQISLNPGEFIIYVDRPQSFGNIGGVDFFEEVLTVNPNPAKENDNINLTFDISKLKNNINEERGYSKTDDLYIEISVFNEINQKDPAKIVGNTTSNREQLKLNKLEGSTYDISINPKELFKDDNFGRLFKLEIVVKNSDNTFEGLNFDKAPFSINLLPEKIIPIVDISPKEFSIDDEITITFNALSASGGKSKLINADKVYMHAGVISTDKPSADWTNVVGNWGEDDGIGLMTEDSTEPFSWTIKLVPRSYFKIENSSPKFLAMVFRNADGTQTGKDENDNDIFIEIPNRVINTIDFNSNSIKYSVFPNPSNGQFNISLPNEINSEIKIYIYNSHGQLISDQFFNNSKNNQLQFDLKNQEKGFYFITIQNDSVNWNGKIIIE